MSSEDRTPMETDKAADGYLLRPIGHVRSSIKDRKNAPRQGFYGGVEAWIEIDARFADGLLGVEVGEEVILLSWLHQAVRDVLQVHPKWKEDLPLTGVFLTRSPDRPNPIGLHRVRILEVAGSRLKVGPLEVIDGTPIVDIKVVIDGWDS